MTEQGLPIADGAPACPFVAFQDDRDERATSPDARHRCYAELRPAPRAHAHQDAYCLSSAFALCPTFQDWARREGARISGSAARGADPDEPQRNPKRAWQAPPPWLAGTDDAAAGTARRARPDWADEASGGARPADAGLSGSLAHQIALGAMPAQPEESAFGGQPATRATGQPAGSIEPPGAWQDGSRAQTPATPERRPGGYPGPPPGMDHPSAAARPQAAWGNADAGPDDPQDHEPPVHVGRTSGSLPGAGRSMVSDPGSRRRAAESIAPPWEQPRRFEAYPTLRTRVGIPAPSRTVLLFFVLVVAAAGLFFLPTLLGFNSPQASPTPAASATPSLLPTPASTPTVDPGPTPQVYVVQAGDTMSRIAARFGVPLSELIEANREAFPNPDDIKVGDQLIIPVPLPTTFPDAGTPQPSAAP